MANEQQRATLTRLRGQQAGSMPTKQARDYAKASAGMDKNYEGVELATDLTARKQQSDKVLGSYKQGGTVPKTGNYKLHKGETVVPKESTSLYKKRSDPTPFAGVTMSPSSSGDIDVDTRQRRADDAARAHNVAVAAGGFEKHVEGSSGPHSRYHQQSQVKVRDGR